MTAKPLGIRAYGHIPHLPGSRTGAGDHHCDKGQYRICCEQTRDKRDRIIVQEKLDGSCVSVAKQRGEILPLIRAGYLATSSQHEQHHLFAAWVRERWQLFDALLWDGERICGEWLALAHGTRYQLPHDPFVAFDLFDVSNRRITVEKLKARVGGVLAMPRELFNGPAPVSIEAAKREIRTSGHGAIDPVEGAVWRVERDDAVDFLAKWVRHDKADGCYLPDKANCTPIWNWRPTQNTAGLLVDEAAR